MIKKKTIWTADFGGKTHEFSSRQNAIKAEIKYNEDKEIENGSDLVEKYFKTRFSNNCCTWSDSCRTFCVDCEKLVAHYEEEADGYDRTYAGKEIYSEPHELFLDGYRCIPCHDKIMKLYEKMIQHYFKNNKKVVLVSFNSLWHFSRLSRENQLELVRIVNCWHNRNKKEKKICQKTKLKN